MPTITRLRDLNKNKKKNNQSAKYYNSKQWKFLRNKYYREHPLCEKCLEQDIITPADHVHHIREFIQGITEEQRWQLLLDPDNLQSLCKYHHQQIHKKIKPEDRFF